ncbi:hypothetical protein GCM10007049_38980 [Echinicola pacifica]|uniref:Transcription elongation factor GreA/GreB C-terminal domain-containing protein n=1 Tax=Echinicola pacifica TaxID=346377 RepID=A0A918QEZ5_9BACT|nr:GreA/GreB family elongation factor [Echinicola pacifica]GGZ41963.1 hypothetical protein GCM10007049_38980 [Echinicola pacifica]
MKAILKKSDYHTIRSIIQSGQSNGQQIDLKQLLTELGNCEVVADELVPTDVVCIGSSVEVLDMEKNNIIKATIVMPDKSNLKENKVSLLAPFSVALIGFKEGREIEWQMPAGKRKLKILKVN